MGFDAGKYTRSKFLKGSDIPAGRTWRVTVKSSYEEYFEEQNKTKPVLIFHEIDQELPLNKTQATTMCDAFSTNTDRWVGQVLQLMPIPSSYVGKPTILITPDPATVPSAQANAGPDQAPPTDADIPF